MACKLSNALARVRMPHPRKVLRQFGIKKCPKKLVISLLFCNFIVDNQLITNIYSDDYH